MDELPPVVDGMYVAYCDVLGFSDLTISRFEETLQLYGGFGKFMAELPQQDVEVTIYSDSVIVTSMSLIRLSQAVQNLWFVALQKT